MVLSKIIFYLLQGGRNLTEVNPQFPGCKEFRPVEESVASWQTVLSLIRYLPFGLGTVCLFSFHLRSTHSFMNCCGIFVLASCKQAHVLPARDFSFFTGGLTTTSKNDSTRHHHPRCQVAVCVNWGSRLWCPDKKIPTIWGLYQDPFMKPTDRY